MDFGQYIDLQGTTCGYFMRKYAKNSSLDTFIWCQYKPLYELCYMEIR